MFRRQESKRSLPAGQAGLRRQKKLFCLGRIRAGLVLLCLLQASFVYGLESSSSFYRFDAITFLSGGGSVSSANNLADFVGIGEAQGNVKELSSLKFGAGIGQAKVVFVLLPSQLEKLISDLEARTEIFGEPILESVWQRDSSPYFSWKIAVTPEDLVTGFAISLDLPPAHQINETLTYYQFPEGKIPSGKHTFYVLPYAPSIGWDENSLLEFEFWVDSIAPAVSGLSPLAGTIIGDGLAVITCFVQDADSGVDSAKTTFNVNGQDAIFSYDTQTQELKFQPTSPLSDGKNSVLLKAYDAVGNYIYKAWDFVLDLRPPAGGIKINAGEEITSSPYLNIYIQATDEVSGIKNIYLSNDGVFDNELNNPYPYQPVIHDWVAKDPDKDGKKTVYAKFQDALGNLSEVYQAEIMLKLASPQTKIISGPASITDKTDAHFKFESTASGALFSYKLDKDSWSSWSASQEANFSALAEGNHYFYVKSAVDANNDGGITPEEEDPTPASWQWTVKPEGDMEKLRKRILFWRR